jgi:hypothetical protein
MPGGKVHGRVTKVFLDDAGGVLRDISSVVRKVSGLPGKTDRPESGALGDDGNRYEVLGKTDAGPVSISGVFKSQALVKNHGREARVMIDQYPLSGRIRTVSIHREVALDDTDAFGDDWKRREIIGKAAGTLGFGGLFDAAAGQTAAAFWAALRAVTPSVVSVAIAGFAIGNMVELISPYETDMGINSDHTTGPVDVQANFVPDGLMDLGVSLHDHVAETAIVNLTGVDQVAVSTTSGWVGHINVSAFAGTSVTIKLQDSADNTTYADLTGGTFTAITGPTKERLVGASNATVRRYVRGAISAGTFTSVTFTLAFASRGTSYGAIGSYRQFYELFRLAATTTFEYGPEGNASGSERYTGESRLQKLDISMDHGAGPIEFSADLVVDSALTRNTYP